MNAFMCVVKDLGNVERRYSGVNKSPDLIPAPYLLLDDAVKLKQMKS